MLLQYLCFVIWFLVFELEVLEWIFKLLILWSFSTLIGIHRQYITSLLPRFLDFISIKILYYFFCKLIFSHCQVDLQAQARAHRIGQKKDVLVLRLETVSALTFVLDLLEHTANYWTGSTWQVFKEINK